VTDILILGGYGNFGKRIAAGLARRGVGVTIAGRDRDKAESLAQSLRAAHPDARIDAVRLDAPRELPAYLAERRPKVVVDTCGPFQGRDYDIAHVCIAAGVHAIDLADGRDYVVGIAALDDAAKAAGVAVVSGASTAPGLSSAVLEAFRGEFSAIDEMRYGISPGQKAERGLATTRAVLGYAGKPLKPVYGDAGPRYGWQDVYRQTYPELGARWMANCEIPDLDLFPKRYGLKRVYFSAGMELAIVHFGIVAMGWLVRLGAPLDLPSHASTLLALSNWLDPLGTDAGGMHVELTGAGPNGEPHKRTWFIVAKNGDGPQIPCVPAILLAERLARGAGPRPGAWPCVGLVTLDDYVDALKPFAVATHTTTA